MQGVLWNLENSPLQGIFSFFLGSDISGIVGALIHHMHSRGVKHIQRVIELALNAGHFSQEKTNGEFLTWSLKQAKIDLTFMNGGSIS